MDERGFGGGRCKEAGWTREDLAAGDDGAAPW